eukprot:UN29127
MSAENFIDFLNSIKSADGKTIIALLRAFNPSLTLSENNKKELKRILSITDKTIEDATEKMVEARGVMKNYAQLGVETTKSTLQTYKKDLNGFPVDEVISLLDTMKKDIEKNDLDHLWHDLRNLWAINNVMKNVLNKKMEHLNPGVLC